MTNEEIITELLDHGLNEAADLIEKLQSEVDRQKAAIKRQAGAAKLLRETTLAEVQHLKDKDRSEYFAAKALDSEREANAALTAEIEQLQRERDEARDRLAEMERKQPELINVGVHQAVEQARREGFCAGIEAAVAAANEADSLELAQHGSQMIIKRILALTPTDKPAVPSVAEVALQEIASQKKTTELETVYDVDIADFEAGYDMCIDRARQALAAREGE